MESFKSPNCWYSDAPGSSSTHPLFQAHTQEGLGGGRVHRSAFFFHYTVPGVQHPACWLLRGSRSVREVVQMPSPVPAPSCSHL
jgi:hypothetical protein